MGERHARWCAGINTEMMMTWPNVILSWPRPPAQPARAMSSPAEESAWLNEAVIRFLQGPLYSTPLMSFIDNNCQIFDTEVRPEARARTHAARAHAPAAWRDTKERGRGTAICASRGAEGSPDRLPAWRGAPRVQGGWVQQATADSFHIPTGLTGACQEECKLEYTRVHEEFKQVRQRVPRGGIDSIASARWAWAWCVGVGGGRDAGGGQHETRRGWPLRARAVGPSGALPCAGAAAPSPPA